jgi:hypothetical protein
VGRDAEERDADKVKARREEIVRRSRQRARAQRLGEAGARDADLKAVDTSRARAVPQPRARRRDDARALVRRRRRREPRGRRRDGSEPTLKIYTMRQRFIKHMLESIGRYVLLKEALVKGAENTDRLVAALVEHGARAQKFEFTFKQGASSKVVTVDGKKYEITEKSA